MRPSVLCTLLSMLASARGDYTCVCNYNVEKTVYGQMDSHTAPLGYMYEFDCKPEMPGSVSGWSVIAFEHSLGYIVKDSQVEVQTCPGEPDRMDVLTTTPKPISTTTQRPTTTTTTTQKRTTTTTATPKPTTTTTTTPKPTTTTTTTPKPTTTTTTTPKPTTITTTTPKPTTTTTTTPKPTTTTTTTSGPTTTRTTTTTTLPPSTIYHDWCPSFILQHSSSIGSHVFSLGSTCYELVPSLRGWFQAQEDCQSRGGHLAVIASSSEESVLYRHVSAFDLGSDDVWIGLSDVQNENIFHWINGEVVHYTNWQSGHKDPVSHQSDDCVQMVYMTGLWDDVDCHKPNAYICQYEKGATIGTQPTTVPVTTPSTTVSTATYLEWCPIDIVQHSNSVNGHVFTYNGVCYEVVPRRKTWGHAQTSCISRGGTLAVVTSAAEGAMLQRHVSAYYNIDVWVGLSDKEHYGQFSWVDGTPLSYTNWSPISPVMSIGETGQCVVMINSGEWRNENCTGHQNAYLCQYGGPLIRRPLVRVPGSIHPVTTTTTTTTPTTTTHTMQGWCPSNVLNHSYQVGGHAFMSSGSSCYELVPLARTWMSAENDCVSRGGHLADVTSGTEQTFIKDHVFAYYGNSVWIGLHDRHREEHFQWTSGVPLTYEYWYSRRFSNYTHMQEDCVVMTHGHNGHWNDAQCLALHGYICEYDMGDSTQSPNNPNNHSQTLPQPTLTDGNTRVCPSGARQMVNHGAILYQHGHWCYALNRNKLFWQQADDACMNAGGGLVKINGAGEQGNIGSFLDRHNINTPVWIGLHDQFVEGQFEWVSNPGTQATYFNWMPGHKNNIDDHQVENCVVMMPGNWNWDDVACDNYPTFGQFPTGQRHAFLCEFRTNGGGGVLSGPQLIG